MCCLKLKHLICAKAQPIEPGGQWIQSSDQLCSVQDYTMQLVHECSDW